MKYALVGNGTVSLTNVDLRRSRGLAIKQASKVQVKCLGVYFTHGTAIGMLDDTNECSFSDIRIREATEYGISFTKTACRIDGLEVSGVPIGVNAIGGGAHLFKARLSHIGEIAFLATRAGSVGIHDSTIENVPIGIHYAKQSCGVCKGLSISNCRKYGILVDGQGKAEIRRIVASDIEGTGVRITDGSTALVEDIKGIRCRNGSFVVDGQAMLDPKSKTGE